MKKLLLLLPLILLSSCGINTTPYTVDTPIWELENHTLNDLFENSSKPLSHYLVDNDTDITELDSQSMNDVYSGSHTTLQATQLVTNGDFSNGTTGWGALQGTNSIESGRLKNVNNTGLLNRTYVTIPNLNGKKIYYSTFIQFVEKPETAQAITIRLDDTYIAQLTTTQTDTINTRWTGIVTVTGACNRLAIGSTAGVVTTYIDDTFIFDITTPIANKQYSPLYNTTFDLMTDAQIKIQMDLWVASGLSTEIFSYQYVLTKVPTLNLTRFVYYMNLYKAIRDDTPIVDEYTNGFYIKDNNIIDYTTLEEETIYSPIYLNTMNNLDDATKKIQLDSWYANGLTTEIYSFDDLQVIVPSLTLSQLSRYYQDYQTLKQIPNTIINTIKADDVIILLITFILLTAGYFIAVKTDTDWLIALTGLLWFVPIFILDNFIIIVFSIVMMLFSFLFAFTKKED